MDYDKVFAVLKAIVDIVGWFKRSLLELISLFDENFQQLMQRVLFKMSQNPRYVTIILYGIAAFWIFRKISKYFKGKVNKTSTIYPEINKMTKTEEKKTVDKTWLTIKWFVYAAIALFIVFLIA